MSCQDSSREGASVRIALTPNGQGWRSRKWDVNVYELTQAPKASLGEGQPLTEWDTRMALGCEEREGIEGMETHR